MAITTKRSVATLSIVLLGSIVAVTLLPFNSQPAYTATANTTVLYDGSLGGTPDEQHFVYQASSSTPTQTFANGATTLDTTAVEDDSAGYFAFPAAIPMMPILDRVEGFTVNFTVQIVSEAHADNDRNGDDIDDRAGFSVIVLSDDLMGIELGFWEDEVWAQDDNSQSADDLFTHDEGANFNTSAALIAYELAITGSAYTLTTAGLSLSGPLRDYTAFGNFPYTIPNLIFLGDDTSLAAAKVKLSHVSITTGATSAVYLPSIINTCDSHFLQR